jgi:hypothetical protein
LSWFNSYLICTNKTHGVDFIEHFTPYAWNLRSGRILFALIYSNLTSCICALCSTYCIFSQSWVRSTLYSVRPTFMKSTPDLTALWYQLSHANIALENVLTIFVHFSLFLFLYSFLVKLIISSIKKVGLILAGEVNRNCD